MPKTESKTSALLKGIESLIGVGLHLFLLSLFLEAVTLAVRGRFSVPISLSLSLQVLLSIPCIAICLSGAIWFARSLNLVRVHLLKGENELVTHGPFAYVRHPLYSTLLISIPPLAIIWLSDLLFVIPWVVAVAASHLVVRVEERGLVQAFGADYENYRRCVPALLPHKGDGGQRFRKSRRDLDSRPIN
jgi:protein-S-isoprenylcysteine O-methyltransferase Ste14